MTHFQVGQKVVCIDDEWPEVFMFGEIFPPRVPMLNEVLTISSINPSSVGGTGIYLTFEEIPLRQSSETFTASVAFVSGNFRPIVERKTDISIFKAMLTPKTEQVQA